MTVFKPRTSGIGSNCSTNWATTTALTIIMKHVECAICDGRSWMCDVNQFDAAMIFVPC